MQTLKNIKSQWVPATADQVHVPAVNTGMTNPLSRIFCAAFAGIKSASLGLLLLIGSSAAFAAGEVESIDTSRSQSTPFRYETLGNTYTWGSATNQRIEGFNFLGNEYRFVNIASRVDVHFANGVTETSGCYLFAEQADDARNLSPSFTSNDASGCELENLFAGRVINRGSLDTFTNSAGVNDATLPQVAGDVERIDVLFEQGIVTPVQPGLLDSAGHALAEMRGDNSLKIAAIVAVDDAGNPTGFGALQEILPTGCSDPQLCYGTTFTFHNYSLLGSDNGNGPSLVAESNDAVAMVFVSARDLGLNPGQTYFGFSLFAADVNAGAHDLTQPQTFPSDTGNSADLYGGMGAYFLLGGTSVANAHVFVDTDADGIRENGEIDLPDISLTLFADNFNGVFDEGDTQVGEVFVTDGNGNVHIPALPNGNYWLLLDENDPDLPIGFFPPGGSNPAPFTVSAGAFISFALANGAAGMPVNDASGGNGGDFDGSTPPGGDGSGGDGSGGDGSGGDGSGGDGSGGDGSGGDGSGGDGSGGDGSGDDGSGDDGSGDDGSGDDGSGDDGSGDDGSGDDGSGGVLAAVPDDFDIAQNRPTLLNVLENDIDPSGGGLTIVGVGSVQNGTAEIVEDGIVFEPTHDFIGEAGFIYTVQDGEGNLAAAPVALTVIRFSDINNNGLNDFDECNCNDLRLITGIDGTGTGYALALWLILFVTVGGRWLRAGQQAARSLHKFHSLVANTRLQQRMFDPDADKRGAS